MITLISFGIPTTIALLGFIAIQTWTVMTAPRY